MPTVKFPEGPTYTQEEVIEILEKAKALGIVEIKLPGFEFSFDPRFVGTDAPEAESQPQQELDPKLLAAVIQHLSPQPSPNLPPPGGPGYGAPYGRMHNGPAMGICFTCGGPKVPGYWGKPYCPDCHQRRKEANFRRGGRWY